LVIAKYFAELIDNQTREDKSIKENYKTMQKLLKESNKLKEILSSNKEAILSAVELY